MCHLHGSKRKWQPTPVFLPEDSHGQSRLAGYSPWGHKESDMAEQGSTLHTGASQVVLVVRNLPDKAGDIRDVGQEDPLEEGMATHSSILAWRIPWTEEPGGQ